MVGYTDDHDPLGNAPASGLVEKAAMFRAAHEALGLLDVDAEEAEMTEGQLRARFIAYERGENWAPRNVADELDATDQAAAQARENAVIRAPSRSPGHHTARADAPGVDEAAAAQLRADAEAAAREAEQLVARAAVLEEADEARARWYVHTAVTRENAHRAGMELRAQHRSPQPRGPRHSGRMDGSPRSGAGRR